MTPKRHRILYIERPPFIGGSVIGLYELVRNLDTDCYEPIILFYGPNPYRERFQALGVRTITLSEEIPTAPPNGSQRDIAASLGQYSHWLATGYQAAKKAYIIARRDWPLAWRVARLIEREAIDLVHHNNSLPGNRATVMAARLARVPQICHVRMLHQFSSFERRLAHSVNTFIYMSRAIEKLYHNLGIPPVQGQVVYDAFTAEASEHTRHTTKLRAEFGLTAQDKLISNVGRIDYWKGQDYFLRAMVEVIRSQPNVKALLVGAPDSTPSSQAYYQSLQQLVSDLQLSHHVIFTGFRSDVPAIMAASDWLAGPSWPPLPAGFWTLSKIR